MISMHILQAILIIFLRCWWGEFVYQSRADHFLYCDLEVILSVRRNASHFKSSKGKIILANHKTIKILVWWDIIRQERQIWRWIIRYMPEYHGWKRIRLKMITNHVMWPVSWSTVYSPGLWNLLASPNKELVSSSPVSPFNETSTAAERDSFAGFPSLLGLASYDQYMYSP